MKKDIYVYFSNKDYYKDLCSNVDFLCFPQYDMIDTMDHSQEEYGKIQLNGLTIRFLIDTGRESNCPWCGYPDQEIVCLAPISPFLRYCAQCPKCLARGPSLNISPSAFKTIDLPDEYKEFILQRWKMRIPKSCPHLPEIPS